MKKKLHPTSQFKRDFKRIMRFPQKVAAFEDIANLLINDLVSDDQRPNHTRVKNALKFQVALLNQGNRSDHLEAAARGPCAGCKTRPE